LGDLARHGNLPVAASSAASLVSVRRAWLAIDGAMATLPEIEFEARQRASGFMNRHTLAATPIADCQNVQAERRRG
jgi:hypothetical protein